MQQANYTLIGSPTSPFVRKLRIFMAQQQIPYQMENVNYLNADEAAYLLTVNPINQLPVLLIDGQPLYESRVIFEYLREMKKLPKLTLVEENILSAIDALLDTVINLFQMKRSNIDIEQDLFLVKRHRDRINALIAFLTPWAKEHNEWDFLAISLYCALDWMRVRAVIDMTPYGELLTHLERFAEAPFVAETAIPAH